LIKAREAFKNAATHEVKKQNVDEIIYCNGGNWIKICIALVEQRDGRIELLHWSGTQTVLDSAEITKLNISTMLNKKSAA